MATAKHVHARTPGDLIAAWRERADFLNRYGDPNAARLWLLAAVELERALAALGEQTLTLVEAATASGFSAAYIGQLVTAGRIPNVGRKHAPRVRRADLPIKSPTGPGRPPRPNGQQGDDAGQVTNIHKLRRR